MAVIKVYPQGGGDYTTLQDAFNDNLSGPAEFEIGKGDFGPLEMSDAVWTPDASNFYHFYPAASAFHYGVIGNTNCAYGTNQGSICVFNSIPAYTRISGLRIASDFNSGDGMSAQSNISGVIIEKCLVELLQTADVAGGGIVVVLTQPIVVTIAAEIRNNICVDLSGPAVTRSGALIKAGVSADADVSTAIVHVYNNTLMRPSGKVSRGLWAYRDGSFSDANLTLVVQNNIGMGSASADFAQFSSGTGTYTKNSKNNISGDTTATLYGGTGNQISQPTSIFNNYAGHDYRNAVGGTQVDGGVTIASFEDDILDKVRPSGSAWDAGAYEGVIVPAPPNSRLSLGLGLGL